MAICTLFHDRHTGIQGRKTDYEDIVINLPRHLAIAEFVHRLNINPDMTTCNCCGPDFSIDEYDLEDIYEYVSMNTLFIDVDYPKPERSLL